MSKEFHNACQLVLDHCPLDEAKSLAKQGLCEWEPEAIVSLAKLLRYILAHSWGSELSHNLQRTFKRTYTQPSLHAILTSAVPAMPDGKAVSDEDWVKAFGPRKLTLKDLDL